MQPNSINAVQCTCSSHLCRWVLHSHVAFVACQRGKKEKKERKERKNRKEKKRKEKKGKEKKRKEKKRKEKKRKEKKRKEKEMSDTGSHAQWQCLIEQSMQDRLTGPDQSSPQSQIAPHPQPQSDSVHSKEQHVSLAVCSL